MTELELENRVDETRVEAEQHEPEVRRDMAVTSALRIPGWLSENEAKLLYGLAHNADGPIVEIGSYMGRSTACLALGSQHGRGNHVWAIDPQVGVVARQHQHGTMFCTPQILYGNLQAIHPELVSIVNIVPKSSTEAYACGLAPTEVAVLFVDGAHDYEAVSTDLKAYLPRVKQGGYVVCHDVTSSEPGVVRAVTEQLLDDPLNWRALDRVDSALVFRRVDTKKQLVQLMCPGSSFCWGTVMGIANASLGAHIVNPDNNGNGFDDFNALWARCLNMHESGEATHAAMLHSDCIPQQGWIDLLLDEMEATGADLISVACALKDNRGVMSCGWGTMENRWGAFRRLTTRELQTLPPTFCTDDAVKVLEHGESLKDKVLLHNTGCWVANLSSPCFKQLMTEGRNEGCLTAWFDFPTRIQRGPDGKWMNLRESEDWHFSRQLHLLGAKTLITRKVRLIHEGRAHFRNDQGWGTCEHGDDDTKPLWSKNGQVEETKT